MEVDYIIVGQGISGTMLSWFLQKAGKTFKVIDNNVPNAPSKLAAGFINPVTGRRFVYTWMIDTIMPFAVQTYQELEQFLEQKLVVQKDIIDFFPSAQMQEAFATRLTENDTYLHSYPDQNHFNQFFNYDFGCGEIKPAYMADFQTLLTTWRQFLQSKNHLTEEAFSVEDLTIKPATVSYKDISAEKIIFCDGLSSLHHPWFKALPFSPVKGELLIIESEALTNEHIFKRGITLAPLFKENQFWVGSSYQWKFENDKPTEGFYKKTKQMLDDWLKVPYKIITHAAAVRPATLERRPFVGLHPHYPTIGILNGMGTKGASLAPFFAHQLAKHLTEGTPIIEEATINRFQKLLSKKG